MMACDRVWSLGVTVREVERHPSQKEEAGMACVLYSVVILLSGFV